MNMFQDIQDFHRKFGLKPVADRPTLLPKDMMDFRLVCGREELQEMEDAYKADNLADVADAIVDLVYFALGTAYLMGLPFDELWQEVHNANMTKVRAKKASDSKRGSKYDVVKPVGWQPPNIQRILDEHSKELCLLASDPNEYCDNCGMCGIDGKR